MKKSYGFMNARGTRMGLALMLCVALAAGFAGCKKEAPVATTEEVTRVTEKETTEETTEGETETRDTGFRNPLTGEMTDTDISANRPFAVMLNTIEQALPQRGNSQADVLIEMTEEGGITRVMGLYQDLTGVGEIGAVRSTREYYLSWVMGFDGILVHAGGDSWVLNQIKTSGYTNMNFLDVGGNYAASAFYRDKERVDRVGSEHALFTTGENLLNKATELKLPVTHENEDYTHFTFAEDGDGTPENGQSASRVKVTFSGYKYNWFTYNETTGLYEVNFWEKPYIDETTGEQIAVKNLIILPVANWTDTDAFKKLRQKYDLSGGTGYYVSGGKAIEINWTKGDFNTDVAQYGAPFSMTTTDGEPIELGVGVTYICVMANSFTAEIEE